MTKLTTCSGTKLITSILHQKALASSWIGSISCNASEMKATHTEQVTIGKVGETIWKCSAAPPEHTSPRHLHPDAERLCAVLAEMNCLKLNMVKRSVLQGEHGEALLRWIK